MNEYILSIVTVTYNAQNSVEKTIRSLLSQMKNVDFRIEYIIQDGLSEDNTVGIVHKYDCEFEQYGVDCVVFSEKDSGIYDAMNKGIQKTRGKWVCLLNAGDTFSDEDSLLKLQPYLLNPAVEILYSDYYRINKYNTRRVIIPDLHMLKNTMILCHQALFVKRSVYLDEKYDCQYKLVADYDFVLRQYLKGRLFEHIHSALINYDTEGISGKNMIDTYKEIYAVRKKHGMIENPNYEKMKYYIGISKRIILANMPQPLRWKLYKIIKG